MQNLQQANKVLFLHGFTQSGERFEEKSKVLKKAILKQDSTLEFLYPTAPINIQEQQYCWLYANKDDKLQFQKEFQQNKTIFYGWEESLEFFKKLPTHEIKYVIAFSQGTYVFTFLLAYDEFYGTNLFPNLKKILLISGVGNPKPANEELQFCDYFNGESKEKQYKIKVPSLHICGEDDKLIENWRTEALEIYYEKVNRYRHKGGHYVPQKREDLDAQLQFLCE